MNARPWPTRRPDSKAAAAPFSFIDPARVWPWRLLICWAAVTVTLETVSLTGVAAPATFGSVPLSWATAVAAVGMLIARSGAVGRFGARWWTTNICVAAMLVTVGIASFGIAEVAGIAVGSAVEELTYRLALPVLIIAAARRLGAGPQASVWTAAGVSTAVFALLPGHLAQVADGGPAVLLVFVAMAVLWFGVLWRGGSVAAAAVCHALVNLTILPLEAGQVTPAARTTVVIALVVAVTLGTGRAVRARAPFAVTRPAQPLP